MPSFYLFRCIPTKEEINECRPFINNRGGLGTTECFFLDLCCYELLNERLDLLLFLWNFSENQGERLIELTGVEQACVELVESKPFKYVLGNVLAVGNFLNSNTMQGVGSKGFKLSFLPKVRLNNFWPIFFTHSFMYQFSSGIDG